MPANDIASIIAEIMGNSGQVGAPGSSMGAVVKPMLASPGFDPYTYGQTSGEATFYHLTPQGKAAPIAAMPGLGATLTNGAGGPGTAPPTNIRRANGGQADWWYNNQWNAHPYEGMAYDWSQNPLKGRTGTMYWYNGRWNTAPMPTAPTTPTTSTRPRRRRA